jgi:isopentenyl diphosphate isomerase/L-lactate dehydrogenase-like FMN-dependent dehydrogenase
MKPHRIVNIEDLRLAARRRVPRVVFDYIDGGADGEITLRENCRAFESVVFHPRCAVATPQCDLKTTIVGIPLSLPFILAPIGSSRMFYPRGEEEASRAAGAAGTGYILSTFSGCRLEDVKSASTGPVLLQLYLVGNRDVSTAMMQRARGAGYSALVVTIDTAVAGMRERDFRNGSRELVLKKFWPMLPFLPQFLAKPRWLWRFMQDGGMMTFPNIVLPDSGPMLYSDVSAALEKSVITWKDFDWIRKVWPGPIMVKGVHTADDARRAVDAGAQAVVVSNHGGRQLDSVDATLRVLPEVVTAVGERIEVLMDGGIRRGSDIAKAMCLGARAVLIGRAYAYGLAAGGHAGVARAIDILRTDLVRTMKLLGCGSVKQLNRTFVSAPFIDHDEPYGAPGTPGTPRTLNA